MLAIPPVRYTLPACCGSSDEFCHGASGDVRGADASIARIGGSNGGAGGGLRDGGGGREGEEDVEAGHSAYSRASRKRWTATMHTLSNGPRHPSIATHSSCCRWRSGECIASG